MQAKTGVIGYCASKLKQITGKGKTDTYPFVEMFGLWCQSAFLASHPSLVVQVRDKRLMTVDRKF